ncbi:uncharacterized protein LOC135384395 [Ornithodoros turicata]|uniref:uncharacterized protein LOC135384395 n=1 Tax=Ornithodoros turicata TaxID=34597 RepID=UPI0031386317
MEWLRNQLQLAADVAGLTAAKNQATYAWQYNRKAKPKSFNVGDQVLVFNSRKILLAVFLAISKMKWSLHCLVEAPPKFVHRVIKRRTVHANHVREYHARVGHVGVVFQDDDEFGTVVHAPSLRDLEQTSLPDIATRHLDKGRAKQIHDIFASFPNLSRQTPGVAAIRKHKVVLKKGLTPTKVYPYRVPEALREEVQKQIHVLLKQGFIYAVNSPFIHPVACVAKKDGTMRLCVDYRHLSAGTVNNAFPMAQQQELIFRVGRAKFFTLIDLMRVTKPHGRG